ncbi:MAG: DUF4893 domain-containing protein [Alphaproteobacteria bacterium]|nr:DUF4893 domain-containing protein [Alphaproteobacteria bacterium]MBV9694759.1 DUF4893 domain-containing protein [Alphaproteobacteria bacterium]
MGGATLRLLTIACAVFAGLPARAGWREAASTHDQNRLARLEEARDRALGEAGDAGPARAVLASPASGADVFGSWRCRTIKLGGMTPLVVYSWFHCTIRDRGGEIAFEKTSGSQRMQGTLTRDGEGYVYLGASWVQGERPHRYSGAGASAGASATPDDQIGRLTATQDGARLELPFPLQESTFDVIELKR